MEPLGLTEQNTGADAVITKSANEPAHLVRSVKRLVNRAAAQAARRRKKPLERASKRSASSRKSVTLEVWCSLVLV